MDTRDVLTEAFGRVKEWVHSALAGLPTDAINYQPDHESNSIGWLVWHLARVQDDHVAHLAGGHQAYSVDGWAARLGLRADDRDIGYGHTPEQVAEVRFEASDDLLAYYAAVHDRTQQYVDSITPQELDRVVDTNWDPPVTAGVRLVSVMDDCMNHTGQAHYVRGLWERLQS
ncbi:MAG: DinB family protein [Acidimicrobiia bacterium]|nr:DinB family protein [Acidimicrobiia bacterium]